MSRRTRCGRNNGGVDGNQVIWPNRFAGANVVDTARFNAIGAILILALAS